MSRRSRFVVCIKNKGYLASLKVRKLYQVIEDPEAEADDLIRVIDDSGEDYLYPAQMFLSAPLPASVEKTLLETTESLAG